MNDVYNRCVLRFRPMLYGGYSLKREFCIGYDIWRETDYPGYFCTYDGKIAQMEFTEYGELKKFLLMKLEQTDNGYQRVEIYFKDNRRRHISVHHIVYSTWVGFIQEGTVIDHRDCNPMNNNADNLQQITQAENIQRAVDLGRFGNHKQKILVLDKFSGQNYIYNSVKDFLIDIEAPEYMIIHGGLSSLNKRRDYIERYNIIKLE